MSVKDGVELPIGSVVSCLTLDPKSKDSFVKITVASDQFVNGSFCQLPSDMIL